MWRGVLWKKGDKNMQRKLEYESALTKCWEFSPGVTRTIEQ